MTMMTALRPTAVSLERQARHGVEGRDHFAAFTAPETVAAARHWRRWARAGQTPPPAPWRTWLIMAGRGFGKTRAGAEWVRERARRGTARIALIGATEAAVRDVMIEGPSGLIAIADDHERPKWHASRGRLVWPSGAQGFVHSGANADGLRGPEFDYAWGDEIAKWEQGQAACTP
jgi:phage terminase large subunit-like protein